ncbi:MAG: 16S rRNA (uracil(1498)-N(3))-methyltransferase [Ignavibacteriales bacterium]|nr:16S rRNA (uracil(1498)-N(3))-methyltransferase [Ignavibacteriales bacterium]
MDFFLTDPDDIHGDTLILRGEEYKHLSRVLRKKIGDHVFVTDGRGQSYEVMIRTLGRSEAECAILRTFSRWNEPKREVTLAVSILKNPARLDLIVEKATELGATTIIPLLCERTIPKHEKHTRLEKIAVSSLKQCGRSVLPKIFVLTRFDTLVEHSKQYELRLIPHEKTEQSQFVGSVMRHHERARSVLIVVGPEGGFSESEIALSGNHGFVPISLGPRRLRSETAALSSLCWVVGGW